MTREACEVAANWWADRLSHVQMQDNGDGFQSLLATYVASVAGSPLTAHERIAFVSSLADRLSKVGRSCGVDYGPDGLLDDALADAVPDDARRRKVSNLWPIKTWMLFDHDSNTVRAAQGYAAELVQIYPLLEAEPRPSPGPEAGEQEKP